MSEFKVGGELRPERHAYWKWRRADTYECSFCGIGYVTNEIDNYQYCFHCGAKMDKKRPVVVIEMEMPQCCGECPLLDDSGDYDCCVVTHEQRGYTFEKYKRRMDKCPLRVKEM